MFEQNDFNQLAEMVSRAVVFQLDTSMLQLENKICDRISGVETRLEKRITEVEVKFDERMTNLEIKYDNLDKKVTELNEKVERLDGKVTELDEKVEKLDEKVTELDGKVEKLDEKVTELDGKVGKLEKDYEQLDMKVSMIQVTVDNQINKNISIIAEGHLSLNEKLDKSLQVMQKQEIMGLQITSLESKIQMIKMQLGYTCQE